MTEKKKKAAPKEKMSKGELKRLGIHVALFGVVVVVVLAACAYAVGYTSAFVAHYDSASSAFSSDPAPWPATLDKTAYNAKLLYLAHIATTTPIIARADVSSTTPKNAAIYSATTSVSIAGKTWPHGTVYPEGNAILPLHRIVAYYGNFYSKQMGVLGEYPEDVVLQKLASTSAAWAAADPRTPVIPAIQYIAVVAQGSAGRDGMWRLRMPDDQIEKALDMAHQLHGILILDVQVGKSTLEAELPELVHYLSMSDVELAIDSEFSMKYGNAPGTVIGTFDAKDVNYAANFLANIVRENHLPPKVLVVHRFTEDMITNAANITPLPEVEIVMDMDGWGSQAKKIGTYTYVVAPQPVQFTGLKLFYHADLKPPSTGMLTMQQVLNLTPAPIYIQYQ
ncbi:MAG: hypothetical protein KGI73_03250 [Patescibacteria group bacterium]|nr:hypothetical protein [Patescibacteria group bacterium]